MPRTSLLLVLLLFFHSMTAASSFLLYSSQDASLMIVTSNVTPTPAEPGGDLLLEVTINNNGKSEAENVSVEIRPPPRILLKNENERVAYFRLCGSCYLTRAYHLHVDPLAVSGNYEVEILAMSEGFAGSVGTTKKIDVPVRGEPQLTIHDVKKNPDVITSDGNFTLGLFIANKGTGTATAISVRALLKDLPFVPLGTDSAVVEELRPGSSKRIDYGFLAKSNGKPAPYSIPVRLGYRNENGEARSSEELVGVRVFGKAKLNVANVKTDPVRIRRGEFFTLMITVENSGQGDAKSVRARVDLPYAGAKTAFLGKIEPGDDSPAVFNLRADTSGGKYNLVMEYTDDLGGHEERQELEITAYEKEGNGIAVVVLAAIGAAVLVAYLLRGSLSGKRKQQQSQD